MRHELKCWPCYFERVRDGSKTFERRDNSDRGFQFDDSVVLHEWSPEMRPMTDEELPEGASSGETEKGYTGRKLEFRIGYVLPLAHDEVVFSLLPVKP